jgi:hypothetical protein
MLALASAIVGLKGSLRHPGLTILSFRADTVTALIAWISPDRLGLSECGAQYIERARKGVRAVVESLFPLWLIPVDGSPRRLLSIAAVLRTSTPRKGTAPLPPWFQRLNRRIGRPLLHSCGKAC